MPQKNEKKMKKKKWLVNTPAEGISDNAHESWCRHRRHLLGERMSDLSASFLLATTPVHFLQVEVRPTQWTLHQN